MGLPGRAPEIITAGRCKHGASPQPVACADKQQNPHPEPHKLETLTRLARVATLAFWAARRAILPVLASGRAKGWLLCTKEQRSDEQVAQRPL